MKHFAESEAACHIITMGEVKDSWKTNVLFCFQEIEEMDADDIMARQVEQLDREKREMQMKLKLQEKRVDHFERAKRLEEIPLLTKQYEEFVVADKEFWDQEQEEKVT
jgi:translation initiation factor 3 subunit A